MAAMAVLLGSGIATASAADAVAPAADATSTDRSQAASADGWRFGGAIATWLRWFPEQNMFPDQGQLYPNLEGWFKADYSWDAGTNRLSFKPYARYDVNGSNDLIDLREAYYLHVGQSWDALVGVNTVHWGVVESRNLVNVINQSDLAYNIDGDESLGQPMANLNLNFANVGTLSLYGLFGFRERFEPDSSDRLRTALSANDADIRASEFEKDVNFAARFSSQYNAPGGSADTAISYFHGINRDPRYEFDINDPTSYTPVYDLIDQIGLEHVYTISALQLKFEGRWRREQDQNNWAVVAGGEYTFYDAFKGAGDIGLLAEYLYDSGNTADSYGLYDHDVFLGLRWTANDHNSSNLLAGFVFDYQNADKYASVKYSTRLLDDLQLEAEGRYFFEKDNAAADFLNDDSYVQMRLTKFF